MSVAAVDWRPALLLTLLAPLTLLADVDALDREAAAAGTLCVRVLDPGPAGATTPRARVTEAAGL